MTRRCARVTQAEIARALRAVAQAGLSAAVLIETGGTIKIVPTVKADSKVAETKEIVL